MDRSLRTVYNLRSLNQSTPETSRQASFTLSASTSTSASSGLLSRENSSSAMAAQAQNSTAVIPDNRMSALLPSPAANETRSSWIQPGSQSLPQMPPSSNSTQDQPQASAASTQAAAAAAVAADYPHQINGMGGPTATAPFLRDLNLVAEAAKRAQMAVVMRDLEGVTL